MKKYSDLMNEKNYFITAMYVKDNQWEDMSRW